MEIINLLRDIGIFSIAMYVIQLVLSKSADRKFESYKTELNHKTREFQALLDSKIELYKAELNLQNYKSTKIYEEQLKVIIDMHKKLNKLNYTMREMTAFMKPVIKDAEAEEDERIKTASEAYNDFLGFFQDNLIFIPKITSIKIEALRSSYFDSYWDYTFGRRMNTKDSFSFEKAVEAGNKVKDKIQPALDQLINDFRNLIGIENKD